MHVLMLHNRYQFPGGEDVSFETEAALLEANGCRVERYEEDNYRIEQLGTTRTAVKSVWSRESYKRIRQVLQRNNYDVMHVQNFFPLISPSAYYAARAEGIAVVQSLRNYRLMCPVGTLFRQGQVCEDCIGKTIAWPGVRHACYRNSVPATSAVALMLSFNRFIGTWAYLVDVYIALTQFGRGKFIQAGLPKEKIMVKPNLAFDDNVIGDGRGGYAVFAGRLEIVKGVETLLSAWQLLENRFPLKIIGEGTLATQVAAITGRNPCIDYLGQRSHKEVMNLLRQASFVIIPSQWYEGFGRLIVEAFSVGTPVIASEIGAMAELIHHGHTGLLFETGNASDLASKIDWAISHPSKLQRMRNHARSEYERKYTPQRNYERLIEIYQTAKRRARKASSQ